MLTFDPSTPLNFENLFANSKSTVQQPTLSSIISHPQPQLQIELPSTQVQPSQAEKRLRGRSTLSDAEKAANKASRDAKKLCEQACSTELPAARPSKKV